MYFEQENFPKNGDLLETIFVQKTGSQDGLYWILDLRSFRVIGLSDAQFHVTIVILQFEMSLEHQRSNLLVLQLPNWSLVKIKCWFCQVTTKILCMGRFV